MSSVNDTSWDAFLCLYMCTKIWILADAQGWTLVFKIVWLTFGKIINVAYPIAVFMKNLLNH